MLRKLFGEEFQIFSVQKKSHHVHECTICKVTDPQQAEVFEQVVTT